MSGTLRAASVTRTMSQRSPGDSPQPAQGGGMEEGMRVLSYLIAGLAVYGFLGWLGDDLLGTEWMLPTGMVLGMAGSVFLIIRRYGQADQAGTEQARAEQGAAKPPTTGRGR